MNKRELVDAISERLGSKKAAAEAVDALLTRSIDRGQGEKVAITGFGSFEKADRPARTARNPATGKSIDVPRRRAEVQGGRDFKNLVAGKYPHRVRRPMPVPRARTSGAVVSVFPG